MEVTLRGFRLAPVGCRFLSLSNTSHARQGFGGSRKTEDFRKDAATILEEEKNGVFRVLDIGKPTSGGGRREGFGRRQFVGKVGPARHTQMKPEQDWGSVWPAPRTFHPAVVPLPVRQGVVQVKNQVVPSKHGNTELLKIPNFLHLTPPVIKKHCAAIKQFCTPWPAALQTDEDVEAHFPLQITTSDYLNSSSSVRDRRSRIVVLSFRLQSLNLDTHARDKIIRLLGTRYDHETDLVTISTDRCPYRGQNLDYGKYLVTALYFEAWKTEPWEQKEYMDLEQYSFEKEEGAKGDYLKTLEELINKGEDELSLREYKEASRKLLNLPAQSVTPDIVSN